jgi:hypothetical protein
VQRHTRDTHDGPPPCGTDRIGCRRQQRAMAIAHAEVIAIDDAQIIA